MFLFALNYSVGDFGPRPVCGRVALSFGSVSQHGNGF